MDISIVLFLLGMNQTTDNESLKNEWNKLSIQQQTALIHQVEREYKINIENVEPNMLEKIRKIQLRSWDHME